MRSMLEETRESVAEKIRTLADLRGVSVLTHKTGDILAKIDEVVDGVSGLVVIVRMMGAKEGGSQSVRIDWRDVNLAVDVVENVLLNQNSLPPGPGAWSVAESIASNLKITTLPGDGPTIEIGDAGLDDITPDPDANPGLLVVRIPLTTSITGTSRTTTN